MGPYYYGLTDWSKPVTLRTFRAKVSGKNIIDYSEQEERMTMSVPTGCGPVQLAVELAVVLLIQLQVKKMSADERYQLISSLRECLTELQEDL